MEGEEAGWHDLKPACGAKGVVGRLHLRSAPTALQQGCAGRVLLLNPRGWRWRRHRRWSYVLEPEPEPESESESEDDDGEAGAQQLYRLSLSARAKEQEGKEKKRTPRRGGGRTEVRQAEPPAAGAAAAPRPRPLFKSTKARVSLLDRQSAPRPDKAEPPAVLSPKRADNKKPGKSRVSLVARQEVPPHAPAIDSPVPSRQADRSLAGWPPDRQAGGEEAAN